MAVTHHNNNDNFLFKKPALLQLCTLYWIRILTILIDLLILFDHLNIKI